MIFSEIYGAYYNTVSHIINNILEEGPISSKEQREIIEKYAFSESLINIEKSIDEEKWQLISKDGLTPIKHKVTRPLSFLEKRWLKAIFLDPRMKLFTDEIKGLEDVEPLFTLDDICYFDRFLDGDPFESEEYINNFRTILKAINNKQILKIEMKTGKGREVVQFFKPELLEYSS